MSLLLFAVALVQAAPPAPPPATAAPSVKDKIICERRAERSLGSNISAPRVCKKKSEWDEDATIARRGLQKFQDRRNDPTPPRNTSVLPPT